MTACQAMREEGAFTFRQLIDILSDIPEGLAWAQCSLASGAYLNTNGTIIGMVQHVAVCKFMYGSTAFRGLEVRWRDCFDRLEVIGPSWDNNIAYLAEAHAYWMACWSDLTDADLDRDFNHFRGVSWPAWKLIATVTQHDAYHGGQMAMLSSQLVAVDSPPDLKLDEERACTLELPGY